MKKAVSSAGRGNIIYLLKYEPVYVMQAVDCANLLMQKVSALNRRTLDSLAAKCYYYYSRAYELTNQLDKVRRLDFKCSEPDLSTYTWEIVSCFQCCLAISIQIVHETVLPTFDENLWLATIAQLYPTTKYFWIQP